MRFAHGRTMRLRDTCTCVVLASVLAAFVSGVFELKHLHLRWGRRHSDCVKLNLLHDITIVGCYKQCAARVSCKSFSYGAVAKTCELCANDDMSGGVVQRPQMGYVLSQKRDWTPNFQASICNCADANKVCDVEDTNTTACTHEECGPPTSPDAHAHLLGNTRDVGSRLIYTCSTVPGGRNVSTVCARNGTWTPAKLNCTDYLGCFEDKKCDRSLPDNHTSSLSNMTTELCRETCRAHYTAGTNFYFGTESGWACMCGADYPKHTNVSESDCSHNCTGNNSQTCGGEWLMSVYKVFQ